MSGDVEALALAFAMDTDYRETLPEQSHVVLAVERIVAATRAEAWDGALRWVRQQADVTSPEYVLERIDRAEPFNPYRAALPDDREGDAS